MSEDLRDVFDDVIAVMLRDSHLRQLRDKVRSAMDAHRRECGNCDHWMKRPTCPREKGVMKGGPSCRDLACDRFDLKPSAIRLREERVEEAIAFARQHDLPIPPFFK